MIDGDLGVVGSDAAAETGPCGVMRPGATVPDRLIGGTPLRAEIGAVVGG